MRRKDFVIGPFVDYSENPILGPGKSFTSKGIYNPTVIKKGNHYSMLFRAEGKDDVSGEIGLASSRDGVHFSVHSEPVVSPGAEFDRLGCEDPRVVNFDDTYFLTYVGNGGIYGVGNICLATSKDLLHWQKRGQVLQPQKGRWDSGQIKAGAILSEKIDGKYVMYFMGEEKRWETAIGMAFSEDLFSWYEAQDDPVVVPRKGDFDSRGVEPGPNPIIIEEGILLVYNGWGRDKVYKPGGILFSKMEPARIISRADKPLLAPSRDYGREFGRSNHVVAEGLVLDGDRWLLYYGAADKLTCVATYERGQKERRPEGQALRSPN